ALQQSGLRGRPVGARRGEPRTGARLNVIETLRAAAPWQRLRQASPGGGGARIQVRREDFHVTRFTQRSETTTIFAVDASGSAALHRLAEAKGAVELLLADCYVRRDNVAVLAFRGKTAELLLPPTRSLVRAKRSLAGLPGGGGTPLAAGIDAALALAEAVRRRGETPVVVLLTDGRANIARDGEPGRTRAGEDALAAARQLQAAGVTALLLDTSPQPQATARQLAAQMGAAYLPLPHAGAAELSQAVRLATAPTAPR
ncbi:VWA domain-containing protein, partial [Methylibium sp.]